MDHRRSPTQSYPNCATLALRHTITTLLTPLKPIADNDDFQSNAWRPLAGLGIAYLRDEDSTQLDDLFCSPPETRSYDVDPIFSCRAPLESIENRQTARFNLVSSPDVGLDSDTDPTKSAIIGLIPDVNMYDSLRWLDLPPPGINPLDTIRSAPLVSCGEPVSEVTPDNDDDKFPTINSKVEASPSPRVIQDIMSILVQPAPESSFLSWTSENPSPGPSFPPSVLIRPERVDEQPLLATCKQHTGSSPILNAHLGIELSDLMSRAERFKSKNPERDIDRTWLSHFAGKLSDRGELLNDFRCYVIGCEQRNKRRDHILVHVGAHIGQRPFACSLCSQRFLRKNECKRHEASHSGTRPYNCEICGQGFVRQDLVKRHVKRTHGMGEKSSSSKKRGRPRLP